MTHIGVAHLASERIAEAPLIAGKVTILTLDSYLEDVGLIHSTNIKDVISVGEGRTTIGMHDLVSDRIVVITLLPIEFFISMFSCFIIA